MVGTRKRLLDADDIHGAWVIIPTPAKSNGQSWREEDTVDVDETARVIDTLIDAGVDGILSLGTFGECATLTGEEKSKFLKVAVDTVRGRVPFFAGTTSLSTRETVKHTRAALDIGADGTMLGLPMWCQPDVPTAVQFYRDVAEACPEIAICVYSNREAFKFDFPRPFWTQVSEIRQVICAKYLDIAPLVADLRSTKGRIRLLPTDINYYLTARVDPENCTAFWSSGANCGPCVSTRLRDEVIKAKKSHAWTTAKLVSDDIAAALAPLFPKGSFAEFSKYNVGLEKARIDAAGWMRAGPPRPPYHLIPEEYLEGARRSGIAWAKLAAQYTAAEAPSAFLGVG